MAARTRPGTPDWRLVGLVNQTKLEHHVQMGMAEPVNVYEAKTQLSKLIDRAMAGEDVVISRSGKPMVRLVPVAAQPARRVPGSARGQIRMDPDFDELPAEVAAAFGGERP